MKIGFLGPRGTYTEEAAKAAMADAVYAPYASIESVFDAVARQEVDRGLVPIENVIQGPVTETLDNLFQRAVDVKIVDMLVLPIQHAIGVLGPQSQVSRVLSKDQALKQCSAYLQANFPQAQCLDVDSTSAAMETIATERLTDAAAIGGETALKQYGLHVLDRDIGNVKQNKTRSLSSAPPRSPITAAPGAMPRPSLCIRTATAWACSTTSFPPSAKITSSTCPSSTRARTPAAPFCSTWRSRGTWRTEPVAACMADLARQFGDQEVEVKVFGTYPRCAFNEPGYPNHRHSRRHRADGAVVQEIPGRGAL